MLQVRMPGDSESQFDWTLGCPVKTSHSILQAAAHLGLNVVGLRNRLLKSYTVGYVSSFIFQ